AFGSGFSGDQLMLFDPGIQGLDISPARTHMALDSGQDVFEELLKTFEECRQPNWDGYEAQPVREETYRLAHRFLASLPLSIPVPSISAEPDGQITVEWHRSPQRTLSVSI